MAIKAQTVEGSEQASGIPGIGEILFLAFPLQTYQALSDEAAKRGHTVAEALQIAIDAYLKGS